MSVKTSKSGKKNSKKVASEFGTGDRIRFQPKAAGKPARRGEFLRIVEPGVAEVKLDGDPFTVCVSSHQIVKSNDTSPTETEEVSMSSKTGTKPTAKELRRSAKSLGIDGWEEMGLKQLTKAVEEAEQAASKGGSKKASKKAAAKKTSKRAAAPVEDDEDDEDTEEDEVEETPAPKKSSKKTAKKAAAKKSAKSSKKAAPADDDEDGDDDTPENGNPFRAKSNLYYIAEEVIKGGKRSKMVARLKKKITLKPRNASDDYDEDAELDRRVMIVGQILENEHGFTVERGGRGPVTGTIVATKD